MTVDIDGQVITRWFELKPVFQDIIPQRFPKNRKIN